MMSVWRVLSGQITTFTGWKMFYGISMKCSGKGTDIQIIDAVLLLMPLSAINI